MPSDNNTFLDSSSNNFAITRVGNTTQGSFSPFSTAPGYWSNYFGGSNSCIQLSANNAFVYGTGDFTVEGWFYGLTDSKGAIIYSQSQSGDNYFVVWAATWNNPSDRRIQVNLANVMYYNDRQWVINTWNHFAVVRKSGVVTVYLNGVGGTAYSGATHNLSNTTYLPTVGGYSHSRSYDFKGNLSNFRIVKGTAVYTTNFTPSTAALTAIPGTSLLTCQSNRFIDNSGNAFSMTPTGNVTVSNFAPFSAPPAGYWSNYFDGSGDYLNFTGGSSVTLNGDFTVEAWIFYNGSISTDPALLSIGRYNVGGGIFYTNNSGQLGLYANESIKFTSNRNVTINAWNHVAFVRSGSTLTCYINGISSGNTIYSETIQESGGVGSYISNGYATAGLSGHFLNGYISNLRVVRGTAVYTTNFTPSTTPLTAITNTSLLTCQTSGFVDNSSNGFTVTPVGNVSVNAANPFAAESAYWSNYFDGTNSWFTIPSNASLNPFGSNFTVELWVYPLTFGDNGFNYLICQDDGGSNSQNFILRIDNTGKILFIYYTSSNRSNVVVMTSSNSLSLNAWSHIAVTNDGTTVRIFANGTGVATSSSQPWAGSNIQTVIGNWSSGVNQTTTYSKLNAYLSNIRIVKGTALYTSNFTPSTAPLTAVSGTSLLTCQSSALKDNSSNKFSITRNGDVAATSAIVPFSRNSLDYSSTYFNDEYKNKFNYWSNYFDGSADKLTLSPGSAFAYGTGAFTIEAWLNPQALTSIYGGGVIFGQNRSGTNYLLASIGVSGASYYIGFTFGTGGGGTGITASVPISLNTWSHVAWVREGTGTNQFKIYLNGVVVATGTVAQNFDDTSQFTPCIGAYAHNSDLDYKGYISNLRVVKGTAIYTAPFTPPTAPLAAVSGTSLLTCNRPGFIDSSSNGLPITAVGNTSVNTLSPFTAFQPAADFTVNGSTYFDGTGDYLTVPANSAFIFGTGDFTIEAWLYLPVAPGSSYVAITDIRNTTAGTGAVLFAVESSRVLSYYFNSTTTFSSNTISLNTWTHVALVRSSGVVTFYINGTASGTVNDSSNKNENPTVYIGRVYDNAWSSFNGYISNLRIVKGTAVYTTNFTPQTSPLTAITGTSLLTCQNYGFKDNSANSFTITPYGHVADVSFSPFKAVSGYWSNYFDGNGDYLSISNSSNLDLSTGNFTIEAWFYWTGNASSTGTIINKDGIYYVTYPSYAIQINENRILSCWVGNGNSGNSYQNLTSNIAFSPNQWVHVAFVKNGTTLTIFQNGVSVATATQTASVINGTKPVLIGWQQNQLNGNYFNGYISNIRIVKGTAVYTSNFTPSTTPLTAISGTSLLTCQSNRFIDSSSNSFTITVNGNVAVNNTNPFPSTGVANNAVYDATTMGGSIYFDGSGDYLTISDNAALEVEDQDFTIEAWIYINSYVSNSAIISKGVGSSPYLIYIGASNEISFYSSGNGSTWNLVADLRLATNPPSKTWHHVAVTRSGSTFRTFFNGVLANTATASGSTFNNSSPVMIGYYGSSFNGYISNLRIVKGTAVYTSNFTPSTTPLSVISGTSLLLKGTNSGIVDGTGKNIIETVGDAKISSAVSTKGSMYFDGTGDYLSIPDNPQLALGNGDFTIEFWLYPLNNGAWWILGKGNASTAAGSAFSFHNGGSWAFYYGSSTLALTRPSMTLNAWQHIAVVRYGGTITIYKDGISISSGSISTNTINTGGTFPLQLGSYAITGYQGYVNDFRITTGIARYTASFTPPTRSSA